MVRSKLFLLPVLCLIVFAQSCIHGDLDDCPPMVNYAVAFKYTHHMYSGDRFYDDVKKINLFVFDDDNLVYTTTYAVGPYDENFNIPLDLPMGKYHIIAWENVLDNGPLSFTPAFEDFKRGVTTLQEARLSLQRDANNTTNENLEKILWGDTIIEIPLYVSRIDTIPLINDTHNVRVVLHWDHTDSPAQSYADYYEDVFVKLLGHNAVYYFDDTPTLNDVNYEPYFMDKTGDILKTSNWENTIRIYYNPEGEIVDMDSTVFDFKVLRLVPGNQLIMTVIQASSVDTVNLLAPIGSIERKDVTFGIDIVGSFTDGNGFSKYKRDILNVSNSEMLQSSFDRYDNYRVDVLLKYSEIANTYFSTTVVKTQDWHVIHQGEPGWAD